MHIYATFRINAIDFVVLWDFFSWNCEFYANSSIKSADFRFILENVYTLVYGRIRSYTVVYGRIRSYTVVEAVYGVVLSCLVLSCLSLLLQVFIENNSNKSISFFMFISFFLLNACSISYWTLVQRYFVQFVDFLYFMYYFFYCFKKKEGLWNIGQSTSQRRRTRYWCVSSKASWKRKASVLR